MNYLLKGVFFACLLYLSPDASHLLREAFWIKRGCGPEELKDLLRSLEQWVDVTVNQPDKVKQRELMRLLTMELKEFTDGEMTLGLTSVPTDKEMKVGHGFGSLP
ncbi:hypothetical protein CHARACLAT_026430 [Characodon lateralis]|uniref:Uncharacterized protein n=1 Tax=Characodon lateralis TaxID=208331 RepID=A0ABU7DK07_9TELE|nr:hypothetical protein [Characodon lateralis]